MKLGITCTNVDDLNTAEGILIQFGDATNTNVIAGGDAVGVVGDIPDRLADAVFNTVAAVNAQIKDGRTFLAYALQQPKAMGA